MAAHAIALGHRRYEFEDLKTVLARATPRRSGDELAGIAAQTDEERVAARMVLADRPLRTFLAEPVIPYGQDEVTRLIIDMHDPGAFALVVDFTVGQFREWLLAYETTG